MELDAPLLVALGLLLVEFCTAFCLAACAVSSIAFCLPVFAVFVVVAANAGVAIAKVDARATPAATRIDAFSCGVLCENFVFAVIFCILFFLTITAPTLWFYLDS